MYTLTVLSTPPLVWSEPEIIRLGPEQSSINGEVPNMTVGIDNTRGQHTVALVASNVLRLRAELSDGVRVVFSGAVQALSIGAEISIELEA